MSRRPEERLGDILEAIHRARLADTRMRSAEAEGDQVGVQVAFDSILHNLFVIGEAVKALPAHLLEADPDAPWSEIASMRDVIGHHYPRIVPAIIHRTIEVDLIPLEQSVSRIRGTL